MNGKIDQVRQQSSEDLVKRLMEIKESLFRMNFKKSMGDTSVVTKLRSEKKELARVKTILRARQLGIG